MDSSVSDIFMIGTGIGIGNIIAAFLAYKRYDGNVLYTLLFGLLSWFYVLLVIISQTFNNTQNKNKK
jgi:hypothetical protein